MIETLLEKTDNAIDVSKKFSKFSFFKNMINFIIVEKKSKNN